MRNDAGCEIRASIDVVTSQADSGGGAERPRRLRTRFGPDKIVLFPLLICFLGSLPAATTLAALSWVPLLPLLGAVWVLRARVVVRPEGVEVCNGLRRRLVAWVDVEGVDVPDRGRVRLLHGGGRTVLTPVPRRDAARLVAAAEQVSGPAGTRP